MPLILQIDFPFAGPWGAELASQFAGLALSIAYEPGLVWKIWTESPERGEAGGIYLFSDQASAEAYLAMHSQRLAAAGVTGARSRIFAINAGLSALDRASV